MRILLIVNASASSVTSRARVVIHKALAADHQVTMAETSRRGHATRLAQGAAADGVEVVVALGGDGTVNETANGLAGSATALGVLPGGSTNVYARTLGMTNDPIEATGELLAALARRSIRSVGLGTVNGRAFLFHVGFGFDAAVVAQVERRGHLKRYAGHALFATAALDTWLRHYDRRRPAFRVRADDGSAGRQVDDGYYAICLKTDPYTYLGERPLSLVPDTGLDSALALVTLRRLDARTVVSVLQRTLRGRPMIEGRRVAVSSGVSRVTVDGYHPIPYQVDGDYLGLAQHFELRYEVDALRLVVP